MPTTKVFCPNAIVTHQLKDYVNKKLEGLAGEMIRTITPKILEVSRGKNDCANTIRLWNEGKVKLVLVDRQYENAGKFFLVFDIRRIRNILIRFLCYNKLTKTVFMIM
jgi:hypothetical protein